MIDREDIAREIRSLLRGASRGSALGLGMLLGMDVIAAGDATGWLRLGLSHPPLTPCLIASLLALIVLLQLEKERARLAGKMGARAD